MEKTFIDPFSEAVMDGGAWSQSCRVERFPLTTKTQNKQNRFVYQAIILRLPAPSSWMRVFARRDKLPDLVPHLVRQRILVFRHRADPPKTVCPAGDQAAAFRHVHVSWQRHLLSVRRRVRNPGAQPSLASPSCAEAPYETGFRKLRRRQPAATERHSPLSVIYSIYQIAFS